MVLTIASDRCVTVENSRSLLMGNYGRVKLRLKVGRRGLLPLRDDYAAIPKPENGEGR